jgi:hypothetical protein
MATDLQQVVPTSLVSFTRNNLMTTKLVATCYEQSVLVLLEQLVESLLPPSTFTAINIVTRL